MSIIKTCATYTIEINDIRGCTKEDILNQIIVNSFKGHIFTESELINAMHFDKKTIKKLINRGLNPYPVRENGEMCFSKNELIRFAKTREGSYYDEQFAEFLNGVYGSYRKYAVYEQPYEEKRNTYRAEIVGTYWTEYTARRARLKFVKEDKLLDADGFRTFDYFIDYNSPFNKTYMSDEVCF